MVRSSSQAPMAGAPGTGVLVYSISPTGDEKGAVIEMAMVSLHSAGPKESVLDERSHNG